jgi:hypothetical protein
MLEDELAEGEDDDDELGSSSSSDDEVAASNSNSSSSTAGINTRSSNSSRGILRPGIVHRLDRGTSGLMVVAKTDFCHAALCSQFKERSVSRIYNAIVAGVPSPAAAHVATNITRDLGNRCMAAAAHQQRMLGSSRLAGGLWQPQAAVGCRLCATHVAQRVCLTPSAFEQCHICLFRLQCAMLLL